MQIKWGLDVWQLLEETKTKNLLVNPGGYTTSVIWSTFPSGSVHTRSETRGKQSVDKRKQ